MCVYPQRRVVNPKCVARSTVRPCAGWKHSQTVELVLVVTCAAHMAPTAFYWTIIGGGAAMDDLQDAPATFHMEGFYLNATCSVCTGGCFSCSACEPLCDVFSGLRGFTQQHFLTVSGCACWVYDVCASRWKIFQTCIMGEAQWNISGNGNL